MKTLTAIFFGMCVITFTSCKRTTSCIESDLSTAKLGQEIIFHNCSIKYEDAIFDPGDYSKTYDEFDFSDDKLTLTYHAPNNYSAEMKVTKGDKEDFETIDIDIEEPTIEELVGEWEYYKMEDVFIFRDVTNTSGTLSITETEFKDVNGNTGTWALIPSKGRLNLDSETFDIYKLYDNELVLSETDGISYIYHYYAKK